MNIKTGCRDGSTVRKGKEMFDQFGEFDSVEDLNRAAEELKAKEDAEKLRELCKENGIDIEDAEDYLYGETNELATPMMAAIGKLGIESRELKLKGVLLDWKDELIVIASAREEFARAIRHRGKDLAGYIALLAENGYENRAVVDQRIVDKAKKIKGIVGAHEFSIGVPDKRTRRQIAEKYYLWEE